MDSWIPLRAEVAVLVFVAACRKTPPVVADAGVVVTEDAGMAEAGPPASRCSVTGTVTLGSGETEDLDIEEGVFTSDAAWVALLRTTHGSRIASVVRLGAKESAAHPVDLGAVAGDVSPPTLFVRGNDVLAASCVLPRADVGASARSEGGHWTVSRLSGDAAAPLLVLAQTGKDVPTLSACAGPSGSPFGAALAWDEDRAGAHAPVTDGGELPRGAVRVAFLTPDLRAVARVDTVSPETSDAERPKVLAREGGFWVAWMARRLEASREPAPDLEAPGEEPAYRWVEVLALDAQGKPAGPVRRLTPALGHASGFEMVSAPASRLDVYVALDDEREQGAGGSIVHAVVTAASPPRTVPLSEGVGRARGLWLDEQSPRPSVLLYVDFADHVRALNLNDEGDADGVASFEPALDELRPFALRRAAHGIEGLAATAPTSTRPSALRWISCNASR
jgi:hypothetical protein